MNAYQALWPQANMKTLWRISYPQRSESFFLTLARGIREAFVVGRAIGVHLGLVATPDSVAQIADFLLTLEKMQWSVVTARYQSHLHVSLRSNDPGAGAGRLLKRLLGGGNRGGGHAMMPGALLSWAPTPRSPPGTSRGQSSRTSDQLGRTLATWPFRPTPQRQPSTE